MKHHELRQMSIFVIAFFIFLCLFMRTDSIAEGRSGDFTGTERSFVFWESSSCSGCHNRIYLENAVSMHEKSFKNPVFQAQYFGKVVAGAETDPALIDEASGCAACHMPIAYLMNNGTVMSVKQVDPQKSGVACDFCHTMTGYKGGKPGNGNYISTPGDIKYGPIEYSNHHQEYSDFFTKSEFCAVCHNAVNSKGVEVKATYTEWKESRYSRDNIQCQDCHMNVNGRLTDGKAVFESGKAADTSLIDFSRLNREQLHTHRFPGAYDKKQMTSTLALNIEVKKDTEDGMLIDVIVDNSQTGHNMPTGSSELRLLWLELRAHFGPTIMSLPAVTMEKTGKLLDVAGLSPFDREVIGNDIPDGMRIYRAVFTDRAGNQTLFSYEAEKIIFDNRLKPSEKRHEFYSFKIPKGVAGNITFTADLHYLRYPGSFAKSINAPAAEAVRLASASRTVRVE